MEHWWGLAKPKSTSRDQRMVGLGVWCIMRTNQETLRLLWDFAVHVAVGTLLFVVIACPAVGLAFGICWLQGLEVDPMILLGLKVAAYVLFATDLLLFIVFLVKTGIRFARNI